MYTSCLERLKMCNASIMIIKVTDSVRSKLSLLAIFDLIDLKLRLL